MRVPRFGPRVPSWVMQVGQDLVQAHKGEMASHKFGPLVQALWSQPKRAHGAWVNGGEWGGGG